MKQLSFFFVLTCAILLSSICGKGQSAIEPLKLGETVPANIWLTIPKKKNTEVIILDFWNTWCATCIASFPKLKKLQDQFKGQLQIVLVNTSETNTDIKNRFSKMNASRSKDKWLGLPLDLPALNGASIFKNIFPHKWVPHYVWLDKEGKIIAITDGENTSIENVESAIKEKRIDLPVKVDFVPDKPLYVGDSQDVDLKDFEYWSLFKRGKIKKSAGIVNKSRSFSKSEGGLRGIAVCNVSMKTLISILTLKLPKSKEYDLGLTPGLEYFEIGSRIFYEVQDFNKLDWPNEWDSIKTKQDKEVWENENLYTYDVLLPKSEAIADKGAVYKQMLKDINRFSAYECVREKRKVKCHILKRTSEIDKIKDTGKDDKMVGIHDGSWHLKNSTLKNFLTEIYSRQGLGESLTAPFLNETNYTGKINISFEKFPSSLAELKAELHRYDLDLIEAEREIDVFVVKDKIVGKDGE